MQAAALGALARLGALQARRRRARPWPPATPAVRRRAVDAAAAAPGARARARRSRAPLTAALGDADPLVVVGAAWFLGERRVRRRRGRRWPAMATAHEDARCREAAVAALGAIGDPAGLPAVLGALDDKPTMRRRATVALAGFDDPGSSRRCGGPRIATGRCARRPTSCSTSPAMTRSGARTAVSRPR